MVNVDIDKELYEEVKQLVEKKKYDYPSVKFFVQKAVYHQMLKSKSSYEENLDEFYSKLKILLQNYPELRSKIDEVFAAEVSAIRKAIER